MPTETSQEARQAILGKIRKALGPATTTPEQLWPTIPRTFRKESSASRAEVLDRLKDRLHDYDAQVLESTRADMTDAIRRMLTARGVNRILLPAGLSQDLLPQGFQFVPDTGLSAAELNTCDGVITECTLAIAETGTIVLQNVPGQGRRAASLVPDYHLCLVETAKVKATVPEAIAALQPTAGLPTTFISGPSATADIEMTRIKGVHGPRFLDVILIAETASL
jgi:L-lactate dehydrogenase complex protein LldG